MGPHRPRRVAVADELLAYRDRFPTLGRGPYFAAHTLGPMPDPAPAALARFTAEWAELGVVAWHGWLEQLREVAGLLEGLFGAPVGSVALGPNVSVLAAQVLSCFDWTGERDRLVTTDLEFPTCDYLYRATETLGAKVEVVSSRDFAVDTERLLEAIDERTALVAVTHGAFRPSAPLGAAGGGVDGCAGGRVTWLLGAPGTGYLSARPEVAASLAPRLVGWFGHEHPFAFRPSPNAFAEGAGRVATRTPHLPAHV